ncbi:MAG: lyase family protein [Thermoleophilia bacterium]
MHTARSRNDQVATDVLMWPRARRWRGSCRGCGVGEALLTQAQQHVDTLLPGYTHLQRAQPVRLAHHLLAYVDAGPRPRPAGGGA